MGEALPIIYHFYFLRIINEKKKSCKMYVMHPVSCLEQLERGQL